MNYINVNGKICSASLAKIPVDNRSFRYGYGIFETILVTNGNIHLLQYHWERLNNGLNKLNIQKDKLFTFTKIENEILDTVKKNKLEKNCRVRLQIFLSGGGIFDYKNNKLQYLIECFQIDEDTLKLNENGLILGKSVGLRKSIDSVSNLKSCSALLYVLAAQQATKNKWNDALILNNQDNIIESTIANIFWIKNGIVYTPPLNEGCVAGVMRRKLIDKYTDIIEKPLTYTSLLSAEEVFLTNAIRGVKWVSNFESSKYGNTIIKNKYNIFFAKN